MDPERWRRIDRLFAEALEVKVEERVAWLEARTANDADMRREVRELLAAEAASAHFLTSLTHDLLATATPSPSGDTAMLGHVVGTYRLESILGRGGMSTVFLGRRADGHYQHTVAIKLIRRGFENAHTLHRFRTERQILARLEHPAIARLYDGGTTQEGLPYLVMERVDGVPIDEYCEAQKIDVAGRLALLRQVCATVEHAHRNLLVHRDLKPSNILVTPEGAVKLLDFGIAKLLAGQGDRQGSEQATEPGRDLTDGPVRAMTPAYASPEQLRGENTTTASDVYALGVILYLLLTGHHPHPDAEDRRAFEKAVLEETPEAPSRVVRERGVGWGSPTDNGHVQLRRWSRRLRGDLDAITLAALAKEPAERYGSARELAEDLERSLKHHPVVARPPTVVYRTGRFLRRNALAATLATLAALLAVTFLGVTWQQNRQIKEERNSTREALSRAEQVSTFLLGLFDQADPDTSRGGELTVREVLDRGSASIDDLADQPELQATHLRTMAIVYRSLGELDQARALLARALRIHHEQGTGGVELALTHNEMGSVWQDLGDHATALDHFRPALAGLRQALGDDHEDVTLMVNNLGLLLYRLGEYEEAERLLREALRGVDRQFGRASGEATAVMSNLALCLHETGRYEQAEPLYREALDLRRQVFGNEHTHVSSSLHNLAHLLHDRGESEAAEAMFRESLAMRRRLLGDAHPRIVSSLEGLGASLLAQSHHDGAEAVFREGLALGEEVLGAGHWRVATIRSLLARTLLAQGRTAEAGELAAAAHSALLLALPEDHIRTRYARAVLGGCHSLAGRDDAEALLQVAYAGLLDRLGPREPMTLDALALLAAHAARSGSPERAAEHRAEYARWRPAEAPSTSDAALSARPAFSALPRTENR